MKSISAITILIVAWMVLTAASILKAAEWDREKQQFSALAELTKPPAFADAEGFAADGSLRPLFFDALPYEGKPTRAFAWLGLPEKRAGKVPGMVLVHGGGGTAFKDWVKEWNDRGYAAISVAVEGQTDLKDDQATEGVIPTKWKQHPWSGPWRVGVYGDSAKPLSDQWMYHAVADTILAHSLLRSLPEVDAEKIGVMGVSWGGIIVSTVIGIDTRFALAIPVYGCGHLYDADNHYRKNLEHNELYRNVLDPMVRLSHASMPVLWLSWPEDQHFPLGCLSACYREAPGPRMISLIPGLGHGQGAPVKRLEGYAFADAVVRTGAPWCLQEDEKTEDGTYSVSFRSDRDFDAAVLVSTKDLGLTGNRTWIETPARLSSQGQVWVASAAIPENATAWFMNLKSGELVVSSTYQEPGAHTAPAD